MLEDARLFVVVPAYNEEHLIETTLAGIPSFVDQIVVVDDASADRTAEIADGLAEKLAGGRIRVVRHAANRGVGASIATGYRVALDAGADAIGVMAGDAQMHPDDLERLALPVVRSEVDYAKGDRLGHPDVRRLMPWGRRIAGRLLSRLTARAAGLAELSDSQCGYTVISARAAARLDLAKLFPRYGYPNDLVGKLALAGFSIRDVPVRPVYGAETSGVRPWHVPVVVGLILRTALRRAIAESALFAPDASPDP
jgi:glycosyltransferase involved in cell wall biosynthesis